MKGVNDFSSITYPVPTSITQAGNGPDIVEMLNFRFSISFTALNANFVWFLKKKTTPKTECVTSLYQESLPNVENEENESQCQKNHSFKNELISFIEMTADFRL